MPSASTTSGATAKSPFRVALTGGIASGKTTVANLFGERGVPMIDTDLIARQVVEPGHIVLQQVVSTFGTDILDTNGQLDRRRMRERIFADHDAKRRLEAILHPAIRHEMETQSLAAGGPYQVLVIPLLTEGGRRDHVDRVLVVDAPESLQIERLMARDGVSHELAQASLKAQAARDARLAVAHDVITNTGRLDELQTQVDALHHRYLAMAAAKAASLGTVSQH